MRGWLRIAARAVAANLMVSRDQAGRVGLEAGRVRGTAASVENGRHKRLVARGFQARPDELDVIGVGDRRPEGVAGFWD